ncbi:MAG TPA: SDR family NAD(P)-dependent oxidoreductase [Firmicutes bacterium]|nr:SDR family NAD(P)-dependent oxidoreductase [Bacillota bacterium]
MKELKGKVAFITGGASGVGFGQARVFAEEAGMKVVIADIRRDHLARALEYFQDKDVPVHGIHLDITDREAYARAADEAENVFGTVQLLCNTAGVSQFGPIEKATYDDWDWQLDVNLKGIINGIMTFVPRMIACGKGGHIVNTASMSAFVAVPSAAIYTTSKFAVRGLSEALRLELEKYDIGVSCLCPGGVNSNIHEAVKARQARYGSTGYYGEDPEVFAELKKAIAWGIDPVDLARITLEGIERNDKWILPFPEFIPLVEKNNAEVMEALRRYTDHPDTKRRMEVMGPPPF